MGHPTASQTLDAKAMCCLLDGLSEHQNLNSCSLAHTCVQSLQFHGLSLRPKGDDDRFSSVNTTDRLTPGSDSTVAGRQDVTVLHGC